MCLVKMMSSCCLHCVSKTCHFGAVYIFVNYWSIFKILSLAHSVDK